MNQRPRQREMKKTSTTKNTKNTSLQKLELPTKKVALLIRITIFCKECRRNPSHNTDKCFKLIKKAKQAAESKSNAKPAAKAFSKRSYPKEANTLARKAGSQNVLGIFESALKCKQARKVKMIKIPNMSVREVIFF